MASIFKRKTAKHDGDLEIYWISYSPLPGVRKTVRGCRDKGETKRLADRLETEKWERRKGLVDPAAAQWAAAEAKPLSAHVDAFCKWLRERGVTEKHAAQTAKRLRRVVDLCGAGRISELSLSRVQDALGRLRGDGLSVATVNYHVRAVKQFGSWLVRDGRARGSAVAHLRTGNAETDRRKERRALSDDELDRLLAAARDGGEVEGMAGVDRAMLYLMAAGTGFRAGELRSLTPESFTLDGEPPTIRVKAAYSKNRKQADQRVARALAAMLRPWLEGKAAGQPVFNMPERTADMMRVDLEAAGVPYRDAAGRINVDFHALRHSYCTRLALSSAPVSVIQALARHSTPVLTLSRYAHVDDAAKMLALDALRPLGMLRQGEAVCAESSARGRLLAAPVSTDGHDAEREGGNEEPESTMPGRARIADPGTFGMVRLEGLEPTTRGLRIRCSTD